MTPGLSSHWKLSIKNENKTEIAIDELMLFIATVANFIDRLSLI